MLVLASLGRPEAWVFTGLYGLWLLWRVPTLSARALVVGGLLFIPAFWFSIPAITSHSWFISGDLALNQQTVIHGNKVVGVINRFRSLYELPMQLAMLAGVVLAVLRRDRATLLVVAAAAAWLLIEIVFAYHGWSAVSRYMIEPAAVMVAVAGSGVGWLLADTRTSRIAALGRARGGARAARRPRPDGRVAGCAWCAGRSATPATPPSRSSASTR